MIRTVTSSEIDKVADGLSRLGYYLPRHASAVKTLLIRLDRVANQLDKDLKKKIVKSSYNDLLDKFDHYRNKSVVFKDDRGQTQTGILVDLLSEGTFIIKSRTGKQYDVATEDIYWENSGKPALSSKKK